MLIEENFEIKKLTSLKVGGRIQKVIFPESIEEFTEVLQKNSNALVVGNLTNTLVSTDGYDGTVIITTKMSNIKIDDTKVVAECGVKGPKLSQKVVEEGLSGLEFMIAFPGTVGGEVFMNAGAHGQEIKNVFVEGQFFDQQCGKVVTLKKEDMEFSYRTSICQKRDLIVLNATFELQKRNIEDIRAQMQENLEFRHLHQPSLALPNCGSVFRNPENNSAGKLLDAAGAKTFSVGNVKVWENHANFIINENGTSTDILELMLKMYGSVDEKFNVKLKPEVKYLGNKNKREAEICKILYPNSIKTLK